MRDLIRDLMQVLGSESCSCAGERALDVQAEDAGCGPRSVTISYLTLGESLYLTGPRRGLGDSDEIIME